MKTSYYAWQKPHINWMLFYKQTCTHLLKTTNANTKADYRHDNSKYKIIMSRYN